MATKPKTPTVTVEKITPELAGEWLNANTHNRPLRNRHVDRLTATINRGEWVLNGESIKFDVKGVLQDGQHRLWAIHLSGKTVETLVVRGLPVVAQQTQDTGERRNLADQLRLAPYNQTGAVNLAAMINFKWQIDNHLLRTTTKPTIQQGLALFDKHPGLADCKSIYSKWQRRFDRTSSIVGVLYYEFSQIDADAAEAFYEKVIGGVGLTEGSPELALRRSVELGKPGTIMLAALTIKAWNAYIEGRRVEKLSWRPVGKVAESFPIIAGKTDYEQV